MAAIKGVYDPFCLKCFKIPFCQCAQNHRRRRRYSLHHPRPAEGATMTVSAQVESDCHGSPVTEAAIDSAEASIEAVPPLLSVGLIDSSDDESDKSPIPSPRRLSLLHTPPAVLVRYYMTLEPQNVQSTPEWPELSHEMLSLGRIHFPVFRGHRDWGQA